MAKKNGTSDGAKPAAPPAHRRGKQFAEWVELMTLLEDTFRQAEKCEPLIEKHSRRELFDKLLDARAILLGGLPWSEPK